ncbi:hypothetical protein Drorol1_Dr00020973 [Drosera rotundifolia]
MLKEGSKGLSMKDLVLIEEVSIKGLKLGDDACKVGDGLEMPVAALKDAPEVNVVNKKLSRANVCDNGRGSYAHVLTSGLDGNRDVSKGILLSYHASDDDLVITLDDVIEECRFRDLAVIGYVLGDNLLFKAMEGFICTQWKDVSLPELLLHDK